MREKNFANFLHHDLLYLTHRRIIKTEENEKVVAAAREAEFIQFFATVAILLQDDLMNGMKSSFSSKSDFQH